MNDEDKKKQGIVIAMTLVCFCICLGGVICVFVSLIIVGNKSCEDICGVKYPQQDRDYNCCTTNRYTDCVTKSECGPWENLLQVGLYVTGGAIILWCCIVAVFGKAPPRPVVTYSPPPVRRRKFVLVQVDD